MAGTRSSSSTGEQHGRKEVGIAKGGVKGRGRVNGVRKSALPSTPTSTSCIRCREQIKILEFSWFMTIILFVPIKPRNSVRSRWNIFSVIKHCNDSHRESVGEGAGNTTRAVRRN
jgi:hypothetical protein